MGKLWDLRYGWLQLFVQPLPVRPSIDAIRRRPLQPIADCLDGLRSERPVHREQRQHSPCLRQRLAETLIRRGDQVLRSVNSRQFLNRLRASTRTRGCKIVRTPVQLDRAHEATSRLLWSIAVLAAGALTVTGCASGGSSDPSSAAATVTSAGTQSVVELDNDPGSGRVSASADGAASPTTAILTDITTAYCYPTADLADPNRYSVVFGEKAGETNDVKFDDFVVACRSGLKLRDALDKQDSIATCVLPDGTLGVLPGAPSTCADLGLPLATG